MNKIIIVASVFALASFTGSAFAEQSGKFVGVWKEKPAANATYTVTNDGENYKLVIDDRNTGSHEYQAVEEKGQLYQVVNGSKRPLFTFVDKETLKWTKLNANLKKQK